MGSHPKTADDDKSIYLNFTKRYESNKLLLGDQRLRLFSNLQKHSNRKFDKAYIKNRNLEKRLSDNITNLTKNHEIYCSAYQRKRNEVLKGIKILDEVKTMHSKKCTEKCVQERTTVMPYYRNICNDVTVNINQNFPKEISQIPNKHKMFYDNSSNGRNRKKYDPVLKFSTHFWKGSSFSDGKGYKKGKID